MGHARTRRNRNPDFQVRRQEKKAKREQKERESQERLLASMEGAPSLLAAVRASRDRSKVQGLTRQKWCDYTRRFGPTVRLPNGLRILRSVFFAERFTPSPRKVTA